MNRLSRGRSSAGTPAEILANAQAEVARLRQSFELWSVYPTYQQLAALLILKGWTQDQFAAWFGRSRRSVIRWFHYGHRFQREQKARLHELVDSLPPAQVSHLPSAPGGDECKP
ncbi:MAG: helix-turn-helix domain-containing protein [Methylococcaceae bacterium]|nr:MAG: helix-turn-helix domain-containing protein [Methylococcaceae bacterium]